MKGFGALLPLEEAMRRALGAAEPITSRETVAIDDALGRVLAEEAISELDVPAFDRCSWDGFALRAADAPTNGRRLPIVGAAYPGQPFRGTVARGTVVRVATGAPLPAGTDVVVPLERVEETDKGIHVKEALAAGTMFSPRGEDIQAGQVVVAKGARLRPGHLAALGAIGREKISVLERPKVAVLSTGREIRTSGSLAPGEVFDANARGLSGLVRECGGIPSILGPVPDALEAFDGALAKAAQFHLMLFSGSSSVGERDHLAHALERAGRQLFHGVAVQPGMPLLAGIVGKTPLIGLPGFPASCLMLGYHLVRPIIARLGGADLERRAIEARLGESVKGSPSKTKLLPVSLRDGVATPEYRGSGSVTGVSRSVGYVVLGPGKDIAAGSSVSVDLF